MMMMKMQGCAFSVAQCDKRDPPKPHKRLPPTPQPSACLPVRCQPQNMHACMAGVTSQPRPSRHTILRQCCPAHHISCAATCPHHTANAPTPAGNKPQSSHCVHTQGVHARAGHTQPRVAWPGVAWHAPGRSRTLRHQPARPPPCTTTIHPNQAVYIVTVDARTRCLAGGMAGTHTRAQRTHPRAHTPSRTRNSNGTQPAAAAMQRPGSARWGLQRATSDATNSKGCSSS
jgi:hypothetical protein